MKNVDRLKSNLFLVFFRTLFPSWKFFSILKPVPKIFYRIIETNQKISEHADWKELSLSGPPVTWRPWVKLLHNPYENYQLTFAVQLEQLLQTIASLNLQAAEDIETLSTYHIVFSYIKNQLRFKYPNALNFQFKIVALEFNKINFNDDPKLAECLISSVQEL